MFFQRVHSDGQQANEKMLSVVSHQEIKIKTTTRYHLTPVRWLPKSLQYSKCLQGRGEKGTLVHAFFFFFLTF